MKYFGLIANISSILGLIASIYMLTQSPSNIYQWFIIGFVALVFLGLLYFYIKPQNPIARTIDSKLNFTGKYFDSKNTIQDVIESDFFVTEKDRGETVQIKLPPYEIPPTIIIFGSSRSTEHFPIVGEVTNHYFTVKIDYYCEIGKWTWRAIGKQLKLKQ